MSNKAFADAAAKYPKNLVIATKNTPIRDDASTDSIVNGMWLIGVCDNWGASMDTCGRSTSPSRSTPWAPARATCAPMPASPRP